MAKVLLTEEYLTDIADAIRAKNNEVEGTDEEVVLSVFAADVERVDDGAVISIADSRGVTKAKLLDGAKGDAYELTHEDKAEIAETVKASDEVAQAVADASTRITLTQLPNGVRITAKDKDGTQTRDLLNGAKGDDGFSPTVSATRTSQGARISVTNKSGTSSVNVYDGARGPMGGSVRVKSNTKANGVTTVVLVDGDGNESTLRISDGSGGGSGGGTGSSTYVHLAWAESQDGTVGFSTVSGDGKPYFGICSNDEQEPPSDPSEYQWMRLGGEVPLATESTAGVVMTDGQTTVTDEDGRISVAKATLTGWKTQPNVKSSFTYIVFGNEHMSYNDSITITTNFVGGVSFSNGFVFDKNYGSGFVFVDTTGDVSFVASSDMRYYGSVPYAAKKTHLFTIDEIKEARDGANVSITASFYKSYGSYSSTGRVLSLVSVVKAGVTAGIPVDDKTITTDALGNISSKITFNRPLYMSTSATGASVSLDCDADFSSYLGYLKLNYQHVVATLAEDYSEDEVTLSDDGKLRVRMAESGKAGIVTPDDETTFVSDGKLRAKSYDEVTERHERTISALLRRVAALERALGVGTMTYDDGTLLTNAQYDDGTLVTSGTYDDGTLL